MEMEDKEVTINVNVKGLERAGNRGSPWDEVEEVEMISKARTTQGDVQLDMVAARGHEHHNPLQGEALNVEGRERQSRAQKSARDGVGPFDAPTSYSSEESDGEHRRYTLREEGLKSRGSPPVEVEDTKTPDSGGDRKRNKPFKGKL